MCIVICKWYFLYQNLRYDLPLHSMLYGINWEQNFGICKIVMSNLCKPWLENMRHDLEVFKVFIVVCIMLCRYVRKRAWWKDTKR